MKKIIVRILVIINIIIIIAMMVTGYAYHLNPNQWGWIAEAGYGFGIPLFANLLMIAVWVFIRLRWVPLPILGMIICYTPVMAFMPINAPKDTPEPFIRVVSYNTWGFGSQCELAKDTSPQEVRPQMMRYLRDTKADIVCLQEAALNEWIKLDVDTILGPTLAYCDTASHVSGNHILIASRYPIKKKERIHYESNGNLSVAFTIDMNGTDVIVINNHLETNSFSVEEKENFSEVVHGKHGKKALARESKFILSKLTNAAKIRASQAEAVASFIRMHSGVPMIVCGDFNDIPLSYAHHTIARDLTDCYIASALGPGNSYHKNAMHVRIDNILCSNHFTPYNCKVDNSISFSDHYPIITDLVMTSNE